MNEKLSALVDAELEGHDRDALLSAIGRDRELRRSWDRYHLIGAAIRNELQAPVGLDLADRISRSIESEKQLNVVRPAFRSPGFIARHAGGFALAASVAAVSIYGVRYIWPDTSRPQPVAASKVAVQPTAVARTDPAQRKWESDLNALLVQHSEYSPTSGMGVVPYVRISGHDEN